MTYRQPAALPVFKNTRETLSKLDSLSPKARREAGIAPALISIVVNEGAKKGHFRDLIFYNATGIIR